MTAPKYTPEEELRGAQAHVALLKASLAKAEARADKAEDFLAREGYRRCDIAACNCGRWHGPPRGELVNLEHPEVHGGVTYADKCMAEVCHVPAPGEPDDVWWLGFDCAHAWDISPGRDYTFTYDGHYRTVEYVKAQCERLAQQILEAAE